jgi:membrane-associated protease RseP (regulator of RpoE activity)
VVSVERGSPAEQAGLQPGDRIRRIGQEKGTDQMNAMVWEWWTQPTGTRVSLEVERKKERAPFELTLLPREKWATLGSSAPRAASAADVRPVPAAPAGKARAADTTAPSSSASSSGSSVELKKGMSESEVVRALGQPRKRVTLGPRTIWSYDGFSVTFVGGKVSDMN